MNEHFARKLARVIRMAVDPVIILTGISVPFIILLNSLDHSTFSLFYVFSISNEEKAIANVLSTLAPLSIVSALSAMAAMFKFIYGILESQAENRSTDSQPNDRLLFGSLFILGLFFMFSNVVLLIELKDSIGQQEPFSVEELRDIKFYSLMTISLTIIMTFLMSAREVPAKDISSSMTNPMDYRVPKSPAAD
ncbi:hypothetical protein [Ascidiaceihabitans sp.]|uniref:hypothetical protein n=1 Tax=Ascidiaceihabitans sp. TaxID=1872644 RepID=UPI003299AF10